MQLNKKKIKITELTKIEAYIQYANQKGTARQKALEV